MAAGAVTTPLGGGPSENPDAPATPAASRAGAEVIDGPSTEALAVTLRTNLGASVTLECGSMLKEAAMVWTSKVRNRRRWADNERSRAAQARHSLDTLEELGVSQRDLKELALADIIEVSVPYVSKDYGWEARVFPWEYVLSAALHSYRLKEASDFTVTRHLVQRHGEAPPEPRKPQRLLIVESAPGRTRDHYDFKSEVNLVKSSLNLGSCEFSTNQTRSELKGRIISQPPDVIHLAGIDTHQAVSLGILPEGEDTRDGYLLRGDGESVDCVDADQLQAILNAAPTRPELVCCNFYNSAARVCALLVAGGTGAAIGFQDGFDDDLTESFFTNFYVAWRHSDWDLLQAFDLACDMLWKSPRGMVGTGVVLWSGRSLVEGLQAAPGSRRSRRQAMLADGPDPDDELYMSVLEEKRRPPERLQAAGNIAEVLKVEVIPHTQLNYSMLHNGRGLFQKFLLKKEQPGLISGIKVEVQLFVGGDTGLSYKDTFDLEDSRDLRDEIRVPLMFGTILRERVHTSLYVRLTQASSANETREVEIWSRTYRVALLPPDEWRDDDTDRVWLPSFVLPRDPAVREVIDSAQRYLMALLDDSNAGFDGYQNADPGGGEATDGVDMQVQAIWSSLVYDRTLNYINPPPTYTSMSQRIRTPSDVINGRRGTCIDLALLLASCLEYVEIYPVIVLLKGHAFPGYWRRYAAHQRFAQGAPPRSTLKPVGDVAEPAGARDIKRPAWYSGLDSDPRAYDTVIDLVRNRDIIPIETVWLTQRGSFFGAIEEGVKNLNNRQDFDAIIDITLARQDNVTPIPLVMA